jgi:hypothetical protein
MQTIALNPQVRSGSLSGFFIESSKKWLVVKPLQLFSNRRYYAEKLETMRNLPVGTIGKDVANMLDAADLKIIPKFENHDLKHLILGYGMSPLDEIRMQAYLIGNGNRSFSCYLFVGLGILMPRYWKTFYADFKRGKDSFSILDLEIDDCMQESTAELIWEYRVSC